MPYAKLVRLRPAEAADPGWSDEALLAACATGDTLALAQLYDRHVQHVVRFLGRMAHVDARDVEDLVQEVFLSAFDSARRFEGNAAVRTWLFAIAANHARGYARGAARKRAALGELQRQNRQHATARDAERPLESRDELGRIALALATLPYRLRVVFVLCEIEQVSGIEAARALGLREGTLYRRLHEARSYLRRAVEGDGSC